MVTITKRTRSTDEYIAVVATAATEDAGMDVALWFYRNYPGYRYIVSDPTKIVSK